MFYFFFLFHVLLSSVWFYSNVVNVVQPLLFKWILLFFCFYILFSSSFLECIYLCLYCYFLFHAMPFCCHGLQSYLMFSFPIFSTSLCSNLSFFLFFLFHCFFVLFLSVLLCLFTTYFVQFCWVFFLSLIYDSSPY